MTSINFDEFDPQADLNELLYPAIPKKDPRSALQARTIDLVSRLNLGHESKIGNSGRSLLGHLKQMSRTSEPIHHASHAKEEPDFSAFTDPLASVVSHKLPIPTSLGVGIYATAKKSEEGATHAVANGIAHVTLDTAVEMASETLAEAFVEDAAAGAAEVVAARVLMPVHSVVPGVLAAHVLRFTADVLQKSIKEIDPPFPIRVGDTDDVYTTGEINHFLDTIALPGRALSEVHHYVADNVKEGLHIIGISDEVMEKAADIASGAISEIGAHALSTNDSL